MPCAVDPVAAFVCSMTEKPEPIKNVISAAIQIPTNEDFNFFIIFTYATSFFQELNAKQHPPKGAISMPVRVFDEYVDFFKFLQNQPVIQGSSGEEFIQNDWQTNHFEL